MGFQEEINSFNELKNFRKLDYLDEVANLLKNFPTNQIPKIEIIREKQETKVKFPIIKNKKTSFKKRLQDKIKSFLCPLCRSSYVSVYKQGPQLRQKKHRHIFILNQEI